MKILLVNKFHFLKGGAERHYFDLAKNLKDHGHKVVFFSTQHEKNTPCAEEKYFTDFAQTEKISFNLAGLKSIFKLWWNFDAAKKIDLLIKKEKPDLVHLHNISHQISPSILPVIKKHHLPVVMTMHDYKLACPNAKMFTHGNVCEKCQGKKYFNCFKNKCVKNSYLASLATFKEMFFHHKILKIYEKNIDLFIAPSIFLKNKMIAWDVPKEKIIHLPYFISQNKSVQEISPLIRGSATAGEATAGRGGGYILYLGRLSEEKGIETLIEAMKSLPDINLKIVGTGPELENYSLFVTRYSLHNVEFLGYKSGAELNEIISQAQCLIVPSNWYEVTGLVVLEAYLNNTPVIASDIGGLPEVVIDNKTGYLFQPKNVKELIEKIKLIFNNHAFQEEMAANGRGLIAKNHQPEKHYQTLLKIYQNLK